MTSGAPALTGPVLVTPEAFQALLDQLGDHQREASQVPTDWGHGYSRGFRKSSDIARAWWQAQA